MAPPMRDILLYLLTWPYYTTFRNYTLLPIRYLGRSGGDPVQQAKAFQAFANGKRNELEFVNLASTLSAVACIGVFSWSSVSDTIWLARALWYNSLFFAIFALISAAQQRALLDTLLRTPLWESGSEPCRRSPDLDLECQTNPNNFHACNEADAQIIPLWVDSWGWNMIYIWQYPQMLMAWSWLTFLVAVGLHIANPLINWSLKGADRKIAIFSLTALSLVVANFVWCSFWIFRISVGSARNPDINLEQSIIRGQIQEEEESGMTNRSVNDEDGDLSEKSRG